MGIAIAIARLLGSRQMWINSLRMMAHKRRVFTVSPPSAAGLRGRASISETNTSSKDGMAVI